MPRRLRRHVRWPSPAMALALVALFVALGGPGYAASLIDGGTLKDRSVPARKLAKNTVGGAEVRESRLGKVPSAANADRLRGKAPSAFLASRAAAGGVLAGRYPTPTLRSPEGWHEIAPGSDVMDLCFDPSTTATFCSEFGGGFYPWSSVGAPYEPVGFYKDQLGIVHLKGMAQVGQTVSSTNPRRLPIFRVPEGYRPGAVRVFPSVGGESGGSDVTIAWIEVAADGLVQLVQDCDSAGARCSATGKFVTLDQVAFRP